MVERLNGIEEVRGSNPLGSTRIWYFQILTSAPKIEAATARQEALIAAGRLRNTGILAGDQADSAYQNTLT